MNPTQAARTIATVAALHHPAALTAASPSLLLTHVGNLDALLSLMPGDAVLVEQRARVLAVLDARVAS